MCFAHICMCTDLYLVSRVPHASAFTRLAFIPRLLVCRRSVPRGAETGYLYRLWPVLLRISYADDRRVHSPLPGPVGDVAGRSPSTINTIGGNSPSPRAAKLGTQRRVQLSSSSERSGSASSQLTTASLPLSGALQAVSHVQGALSRNAELQYLQVARASGRRRRLAVPRATARTAELQNLEVAPARRLGARLLIPVLLCRVAT